MAQPMLRCDAMRRARGAMPGPLPDRHCPGRTAPHRVALLAAERLGKLRHSWESSRSRKIVGARESLAMRTSASRHASTDALRPSVDSRARSRSCSGRGSNQQLRRELLTARARRGYTPFRRNSQTCTDVDEVPADECAIAPRILLVGCAFNRDAQGIVDTHPDTRGLRCPAQLVTRFRWRLWLQ